MSDSAGNTDNSNAAPVAVSEPRRGVSWLAVFALLLSLCALGAAGFSGWQLFLLRSVPTQLNVAANEYEDLADQLSQLQRNISIQKTTIGELDDALVTGLATVSDIPLRIEQVETLVKSVPGVEAKQRADWLREEALYYLRIANAQALLTGNAQVAVKALELADEKLRATGDPRMAVVRASLSDEIVALRSVPSIDREGVSFKLQALIGRANEWPFRKASPNSFRPSIEVPEVDLGSWERFKATLTSVFATIISVKKVEGSPLEQQLDVTERVLIVENLRAEMQIARLAFLSNNAGLFNQALTNSANQLNQYFDPDAGSVAGALADLSELGETAFPGPMPDISESLALFLEADVAE